MDEVIWRTVLEVLPHLNIFHRCTQVYKMRKSYFKKVCMTAGFVKRKFLLIYLGNVMKFSELLISHKYHV